MELPGLPIRIIWHHILMGYGGIIDGIQYGLIKSVVFRVLKKTPSKALSQQFLRLTIQNLHSRGIYIGDDAVQPNGHHTLGHILYNTLPYKICMLHHIRYPPKPKYPCCFRKARDCSTPVILPTSNVMGTLRPSCRHRLSANAQSTFPKPKGRCSSN